MQQLNVIAYVFSVASATGIGAILILVLVDNLKKNDEHKELNKGTLKLLATILVISLLIQYI